MAHIDYTTETKAVIFNIQKYSIGDGPGIRTTVFFKGCPLRCLWCHNPEGLWSKVEVSWHREDCVRCLACINGCPRKAISLDGNSIVTERSKCNACGKCINICSFGAREIIGKYMTVKQVLDEVMTDKLFYEYSGGGVTCSGGEVLMQAEFVAVLFEELKKHGVHTTLDTSGFGEWSRFSNIIRYTDLVLFDLKHMDGEKHFQMTGQDVKLIHSNFEKLAQTNTPVFVRIPVIPDFNDDEDSIKAIINYAAGFSNVRKVELLPYHNLGESKYEMFNEPYKLAGIRSVKEEKMARLREIVSNSFSD